MATAERSIRNGGTDVTGQRFGKLTAVRREWDAGYSKWLFRCDCGAEHVYLLGNVKAGNNTNGCKDCRPPEQRSLDITGHTYGLLKVLSFVGRINGNSIWLARCTCGSVRQYHLGNLRGGYTTGCVECQGQRVSQKRGNRSRELLYQTWKRFRICMCQSWRESYDAFKQGVGSPPNPKGYVLRRKNDRILMGPENFIWLSRSELNRGLHDIKRYTHDGKTMTARQWAEHLGVTRQRIYQRLEKMPVEMALSYRKGDKSPAQEAVWKAKREARAERRKRYLADREQRRKQRLAVLSTTLSHAARRERRRVMAEMVAAGSSLAAVADHFHVTESTVRNAVNESLLSPAPQ